jgi:hypothetical protein
VGDRRGAEVEEVVSHRRSCTERTPLLIDQGREHTRGFVLELALIDAEAWDPEQQGGLLLATVRCRHSGRRGRGPRHR